MSEQNILNPAATSLLNFDYGYDEEQPETFTRFQAESGKSIGRRQLGLGRIYNLLWQKRDLTTKHALQQWAKQYENDFFSLQDFERGRYFSGRFDGPLSFSPQGNNNYTIKGRFIELPGIPIFDYPSNWARDAIFLEERNGFGEDMFKLTGTWNSFSSGSQHGGTSYYSGIANDTAELIYFGYGCRFWAEKAPDSGKCEFSLTNLFGAFGVNGPFTFDGYSAAPVISSPVQTILETLGWHRAKIKVLGTRNVASSGFNVFADALEVMQ